MARAIYIPGAAAAVTAGPNQVDLTDGTWTEYDPNSLDDGDVTYSAGLNTIPVAGDSGNNVTTSGVGSRVFYKRLTDQDGANLDWSDDYVVALDINLKIPNSATINNSGVEVAVGVFMSGQGTGTPEGGYVVFRFTSATASHANLLYGGDGVLSSYGATRADVVTIHMILAKDLGGTYPRVVETLANTYKGTPATPLLEQDDDARRANGGSEQSTSSGQAHIFVASGCVNNGTDADPDLWMTYQADKVTP